MQDSKKDTDFFFFECPLDCKEIQPVHPKGDQSWVFIGRTVAEAETPILGHLMQRADSLEKTLRLGKIGGRRRRGRQRMRWLDGLAVQRTLKSLLQHRSSKASILQCSAFFTVQLSHPYMTTGKNILMSPHFTDEGNELKLIKSLVPSLTARSGIST